MIRPLLFTWKRLLKDLSHQDNHIWMIILVNIFNQVTAVHLTVRCQYILQRTIVSSWLFDWNALFKPTKTIRPFSFSIWYWLVICWVTNVILPSWTPMMAYCMPGMGRWPLYMAPDYPLVLLIKYSYVSTDTLQCWPRGVAHRHVVLNMRWCDECRSFSLMTDH